MERTTASRELMLSSPKVEDPPPPLSSSGVVLLLGPGVVASLVPDEVFPSLSS